MTNPSSTFIRRKTVAPGLKLVNESVWHSLNQMADLFGRDKSVISKHVKNVFDEGEWQPEATVAKYATVQKESGREVLGEIEYYNLDVIISNGESYLSNYASLSRTGSTGK